MLWTYWLYDAASGYARGLREDDMSPPYFFCCVSSDLLPDLLEETMLDGCIPDGALSEKTNNGKQSCSYLPMSHKLFASDERVLLRLLRGPSFDGIHVEQTRDEIDK
mgnify:CR=1 FL=1